MSEMMDENREHAPLFEIGEDGRRGKECVWEMDENQISKLSKLTSFEIGEDCERINKLSKRKEY